MHKKCFKIFNDIWINQRKQEQIYKPGIEFKICNKCLDIVINKLEKHINGRS